MEGLACREMSEPVNGARFPVTHCEEDGQAVETVTAAASGCGPEAGMEQCGGGTCSLQALGGRRQLWRSAAVQAEAKPGEEALVRP